MYETFLFIYFFIFLCKLAFSYFSSSLFQLSINYDINLMIEDQTNLVLIKTVIYLIWAFTAVLTQMTQIYLCGGSACPEPGGSYQEWTEVT